MTERPAGTVTFLVTDIEQSTRRWEDEPETMRAALLKHDATLRDAIERHGGWMFKHTGDGVLAAFALAKPAIEAAIAAQLTLELPVRMGLLTGEAEPHGEDYFGPAINRAVRVMAAAHGGQIIAAASTAAIADGVALDDLGEFRLRDLSQPQRLFQVRAPGLKESFPPLRTLDSLPGNLPAQATSFLGRDGDLVEVRKLLRETRLLTLTGVGGVGKTRLAVQAAADAAASYKDGVWLIELAGVADPAAIAHAVASVLGIAQQQGKTIEDSISAALGGRQILIVLDNCEHLIEASAGLADLLLTHCKDVRLLATSREALMVDGEQIWPVPSLSFRDGAQSPAVALFIDRARAVAPDFDTASDVEATAEICRRLDGIPLAIELAAARVRAMSPAQIRDRLNERFRLLTGGARRALERHQTLRHAVQWSYDLLTPAERTVLARASVFYGGFSLEAAESICAGGEIAAIDILDICDSLVRKSLVNVERSGAGIRYGLLETIRQFAEEQLVAMSEGESVRARHARYFAADAEAKFKLWLSKDQLMAYEWLDREIDNLRAAFRWATDRADIDVAADIASNIGDMGRFRMREEAALWAEEIVDAARAAGHRRLIYLLSWAGSTAWSVGRMEDAKRFGNEAITLLDRPEFDPILWAYTDLATIALIEGNLGQAVALMQEGAEHPLDRADRFCLASMPFVLSAAGRYEEATSIADSVTAAVDAAGVPSSISLAHFGKAEALTPSDPSAALKACGHALAVANNSGNRFWANMASSRIAALHAKIGDSSAALRGYRQIFHVSGRSADFGFALTGLGGLAQALQLAGEPIPAATLFGFVSTRLDKRSLPAQALESIDGLQQELGVAVFTQTMSIGAAMTQPEIERYATGQIDKALAKLEGSGAP
jgi:predicted ATPase/class 3 adenylate cyclase